MQQQSIKDKAHGGRTHGATFRSTPMRDVCTHNSNRVHGGGTVVETVLCEFTLVCKEWMWYSDPLVVVVFVRFNNFHLHESAKLQIGFALCIKR